METCNNTNHENIGKIRSTGNLSKHKIVTVVTKVTVEAREILINLVTKITVLTKLTIITMGIWVNFVKKVTIVTEGTISTM
jgi:hypothetical protein